MSIPRLACRPFTPLSPICCKSVPWKLCRHILSALYNVAERYDADAIWGVLRELTPHSARVMWASKTHEVQLFVAPVKTQTAWLVRHGMVFSSLRFYWGKSLALNS